MARVIISDESLKDNNKALVLEAFDTLFNRRDYWCTTISTRLFSK